MTTSPPSSTRAWPHRLAAILLVLAVLRVAGVVLHTPMLGYANQYDMARTSA